MMPAIQPSISVTNLLLAPPTASPTASFGAMLNDAAASPGPIRANDQTPSAITLPVVDPGSTPVAQATVPAQTAPATPVVAHPPGREQVAPPPPAVDAADQGLDSIIPATAEKEPVDKRPACEVLKAALAPEAIIAAPTVAVAVQPAPTLPRAPVTRDLPRRIDGTSGAVRQAAPMLAASNMVAVPAIATGAAARPSGPQTDSLQSEALVPAIDQTIQNAPVSAPGHRLIAEPVPLNIPAPANATPQMFHELDLARDLAWIGNLAQEIVAVSDDRESLHFRLMPRSMGQLDVSLLRSPDGLQVEMTATTERAQHIITAEQPRLIEELRQSGVKTAGTDLASGQQPGSQRGNAQPERGNAQPERGGQPFAVHDSQSPPRKNANRPGGRFA
jgi:flagellar hook-length control protein FliK